MNIYKILKSTFYDELSNISKYYVLLERESPDSRKNIVSKANKELSNIKQLIASTHMHNAINQLLEFQYVTRFKLPIRGKYYSKSKDYFIDKFDHLLIGCSVKYNRDRYYGGYNSPEMVAYSKVQSFGLKTPPFDEFLEGILPFVLKSKFCDQADFCCMELYSLPLPCASKMTFDDWIKNSSVLDENWSKEYISQMEIENSRWFKSKKKIQEIQNMLEQQRVSTSACIDYIASCYTSISDAANLMLSIQDKHLKLSVNVSDLNDAYKAINEGINLKYLLLERGIIWDKSLNNF